MDRRQRYIHKRRVALHSPVDPLVARVIKILGIAIFVGLIGLVLAPGFY